VIRAQTRERLRLAVFLAVGAAYIAVTLYVTIRLNSAPFPPYRLL